MIPAQTNEGARWKAVTSRAATSADRFFYAVRTTGVFCVPTCASRRPRRENVEFFDTTEAAIGAGYRPCKRCRPNEKSAADESATAIITACRLLSSEDTMATRDVAKAVGLSDSHFQRHFKKQLGVTPQQYRRRVLAERGRAAIGRGRSVTESIYEAGYSSSSRFYEGVGRELGMKPSTARDGGAGERIEFAVGRCSLGYALIARTARGVCEVAFADSAQGLVPQLEAHFPNATLKPSAEDAWARAVIDAVDTAEPAELPLDIRGTAFQERVWQALRTIPRGETRTYTEVAESLGEPRGARAVARACASNKIAVLVPCHRVVRKDGNPSGYRWGLERKKELLRIEKEAATERRSPG
ncbi:MAG: bifunctional DNA-binding transcriptional regulator/O6-methylguanine-DNA methyltransferase Ada [Polyangiales bacterium]